MFWEPTQINLSSSAYNLFKLASQFSVLLSTMLRARADAGKRSYQKIVRICRIVAVGSYDMFRTVVEVKNPLNSVRSSWKICHCSGVELKCIQYSGTLSNVLVQFFEWFSATMVGLCSFHACPDSFSWWKVLALEWRPYPQEVHGVHTRERVPRIFQFWICSTSSCITLKVNLKKALVLASSDSAELYSFLVNRWFLLRNYLLFAGKSVTWIVASISESWVLLKLNLRQIKYLLVKTKNRG